MYDEMTPWLSDDVFQKVLEYCSSLGEAIEKAFAPFISAIQEFLEQIETGEIELAEEDTHQHNTTKLYSCKIPGIFHRYLVPWYPSGFT